VCADANEGEQGHILHIYFSEGGRSRRPSPILRIKARFAHLGGMPLAMSASSPLAAIATHALKIGPRNDGLVADGAKA
jgi:hypothetical protein